MCRSTAALLFSLALLFPAGVFSGGRDIKQLIGGSGVYNYQINYGSGYGDYEEICFSGLEVVEGLNQTYGNLGTFLEAIFSTGIVDVIADPLLVATIFVPTDEAFDAAAMLLGLSNSDLLNSPLLIPILLYHMVPAPLLESDLSNDEVLPTSLGQNLTVLTAESSNLVSTQSVSGEHAKVTINATESEATIVNADNCNCNICNTAIQVIDNVLLPDILDVQQNDTEVLITIGNGKGLKQYFLVVYEDLSPSPAVAESYTPASEEAAPSPVPSGAKENAASPSQLGPSVSTSNGRTTSAGTTYYTNAGLTD